MGSSGSRFQRSRSSRGMTGYLDTESADHAVARYRCSFASSSANACPSFSRCSSVRDVRAEIGTTRLAQSHNQGHNVGHAILMGLEAWIGISVFVLLMVLGI